MSAAEVTYHGPKRDAHGCIVGWPETHAVAVRLPRDDRTPAERQRAAVDAARAYCHPDGYDEPNDGRHRHPVAVLALDHRALRAGSDYYITMRPEEPTR